MCVSKVQMAWELLCCLALVAGSHIPCAWIYSVSCLFFMSDIWVLFYIMFSFLFRLLCSTLLSLLSLWFWNIFFLHGMTCLGFWELPELFLQVLCKVFLCFPCLYRQNGLYVLHFSVLSLAVSGEEPLPWVFSCANVLSHCIYELGIWGLPFPAFSCVLDCSIPNLMAWKPHKKCLCLTDRLGLAFKCQPKASKWVTVHTRI